SGAFAQYVAVPAPIVEQNLLAIPEGVSFPLAAMVEPLACVAHGMEVTNIALGDTVAVIGAGPIGLMFVQLAALRGARVIAVDIKEERLAAARACGARETVAAPGDDAVEAVRGLTDGKRGVDVAIEAVGLPGLWEKAVRMVRKGGTVNLFGGCAGGTQITIDTSLIHYSEVTIRGAFHHNPRTVSQAMELIAMGALQEKVFITREIPLVKIEEVLRALVEQEGIKSAVIP
ncbi:MAG: zinc-binding dehydrogenase, partial [Planctomycetota bacterium]